MYKCFEDLPKYFGEKSGNIFIFFLHVMYSHRYVYMSVKMTFHNKHLENITDKLGEAKKKA